MDNGQILSWAY